MKIITSIQMAESLSDIRFQVLESDIIVTRYNRPLYLCRQYNKDKDRKKKKISINELRNNYTFYISEVVNKKQAFVVYQQGRLVFTISRLSKSLSKQASSKLSNITI